MRAWKTCNAKYCSIAWMPKCIKHSTRDSEQNFMEIMSTKSKYTYQYGMENRKMHIINGTNSEQQNRTTTSKEEGQCIYRKLVRKLMMLPTSKKFISLCNVMCGGDNTCKRNGQTNIHGQPTEFRERQCKIRTEKENTFAFILYIHKTEKNTVHDHISHTKKEVRLHMNS